MRIKFYQLGLSLLIAGFSMAQKVAGFEGRQVAPFIENKGQVSDQWHHARPDVLFAGTANGIGYQLRANGISYQLSRVDAWKEDKLAKNDLRLPSQSTIYRLDINWLNANPAARIRKDGESNSGSNYYLAHCPGGVFDVRAYETLIYENIYKGIDLKWYQKEGQLKYDYLVAAGADYRQIRLEFNGAESITLNAKGELVLKTPLGSIIEQAPLVTQDGKVLSSSWSLKGNVIGFHIDGADPSQPLVIDPVVRVWGTYFGADNTTALCNTIDASENVYVTGYSTASVMVATSGAYQTTLLGGLDGFVARYSSSGALQWATYYGGDIGCTLYSCALDAAGNIYVSGLTSSTMAIASSGSYQQTSGGGQDACLAKFNGSGVLQWATYYGGSGTDAGYYCATDASGNVYLSGFAASTVNIASSGAYQTTFAGNTDAFVVKFNSSGARQWATYLGGVNSDVAYYCTTDGSGNIYISGVSYSPSGVATAAAHQTVLAGGSDVFLAKFNTSGAMQWSTYYGGSGSEDRGFCTTDASGNVFLGGITGNSTGTAVATAGSHQTSYGGGNWDSFLAKFNSSGVRQWGTYYGGSNGQDDAHGCTTDALGNVYLAGTAPASSSAAIVSAGAYQTVSGGPNDGYLAKFDANGVRQWGTLYGGSDFDVAYTCATSTTGNIYMCGVTGSSVGISTSGAAQQSFSGTSQNAYIVKFFDCSLPAAPVNVTPAGSQTLCAGATVTLSATGSNTVSWYAAASSTQAIGTGTNFPLSSTLTAGSYTYYTEAANNCSISASRTPVTFTVQSLPTLSVNSGTLCSGGVFTVTPSGAATYSLNGGSTFTVSPAGNASYSVTGTNSLGCTSAGAAIASVTVIALPVISVNSASICAGQSVVITPTGAASYSVNGGSGFTVSPSVNTSYSVTGTSTAGCVSASAAIAAITVYSLPLVSAPAGSICAGQVFTFSPSGAATHSVNGSSVFTVSPSATAAYSVTGTSTSGCVSTVAIVAVTVNALPTISVTNGTICAGQSFTITPAGAGSYTYSGGSNVVSPSGSVSYSVTGTSTAGCAATNTAVVAVTVNTLPVISVNSGSVCSGRTFTLAPNGAVSYSLNGVATSVFTVSPSSSAAYSLSGMSTAGCTSTLFAVASVTVVSSPVVSVNNGSVCIGQTFTLSPSGAASYSVNGAATAVFTVNPSVTTSYSVTGTSTAGCVSSSAAVAMVTVAPLPVISVNSGSICSGSVFTLQPAGAATYSVNGSAASVFTVSPSSGQSYSISGTSTAGCVSSSVAISAVTVVTLPVVSVNSGSICAGSSFVLAPSGAASYSVNGNGSASFTVSPAANTSYSITGVGTSGCLSSAAAVASVTVNSLPLVSVNSGSVCSGSSFTLVPSGASSYTVTGGSLVVSPASTTSYSVTGTSTAGCVSAAAAVSQVTVLPTPLVTASSAQGTICAGESMTLSAGGAASYTWSTTESSVHILVSPAITTEYTVTGTAVNGCTGTASVQQFVNTCVGIPELNSGAAISLYPNPTAGEFSINSDRALNISILNALGQVIFSSELNAGLTKLSLSGYASGVYFICTGRDGKILKLIKE